MLLVDDLLFAPVRGILWIFREIHKRARQELDEEPEVIAGQLRNLYMRLETGQISEPEFEVEEQELLDRLEEIQARGELTGDEEQAGAAEEPEDDGEEPDAEAKGGEQEQEEDQQEQEVAPHAGKP